jgi:hypothetical protein
MGEYVASETGGGFIRGAEWMVWDFESDSTLYDAIEGALGKFPADVSEIFLGCAPPLPKLLPSLSASHFFLCRSFVFGEGGNIERVEKQVFDFFLVCNTKDHMQVQASPPVISVAFLLELIALYNQYSVTRLSAPPHPMRLWVLQLSSSTQNGLMTALIRASLI